MPTKPRFLGGFPLRPRSVLRNRQGIPRLSGVSSRAHEAGMRENGLQKGYALRLYDKIIKDDLEIICRVRNAFAHSPRAINFDTPEVLSAIMRLKYLRVHKEKRRESSVRLPPSRYF